MYVCVCRGYSLSLFFFFFFFSFLFKLFFECKIFFRLFSLYLWYLPVIFWSCRPVFMTGDNKKKNEEEEEETFKKL